MGKTKKKQTREEKLAKKRLAEKKRMEKIKSDPQLYEEFKAKDRARYYKKKEEKKVLPISEMTPRRQRIQRKRNRDNFKAYYTRQKIKKGLNNFLNENSPPESDNELLPQLPLQNRQPLTRNDPVAPASLCSSVTRTSRRRSNSSAPASPCQSNSVSRASPSRSRFIAPASPCSSNSSFSSTVSKSTFRKYQYKKTKIIVNLQKRILELQREKDTLKKRAIRMKSIKINNSQDPSKINKIPKKINKKPISHAQFLKQKVQDFFSDDENSRLCPGKKDYISKNKVKHQKRYLTDTLQNLFKKFVTTHPCRIHYSTFCRLRPFWILIPDVNIRDTCVCKVHENMALLIQSLKSNKIISESNSTELLENLTCDRNNIDCLQKKCALCNSKVIQYHEFDNSTIISYNSWEKRKQSYTKRGKEKESNIIEKLKISDSPLNVIKKLENNIKPFMHHCAKIINQSHALKTVKDSLKAKECVLHIDFSENYNTKFGTEIQAMHFGGNRKQITLHTAVLYYYDEKTSVKVTKSICTISKCLRHDAPAVWAHIVPILKFIEENCAQVRTINIFSDSPSSQYRNKKIFYLMSKLCWHLPFLKSVTWNYSESGHGKGAPDGVGGVLKRTADKHVAFGNDIKDVDSLVTFLNENVPGVFIKVVEEYDIFEKDLLFPQKLPMFSGTMKVHQAIWDSENKNCVMLRTMTCTQECFSKAIACPHGKHLGIYNTEILQETTTQDNPDKRIRVLSEIVLNPLFTASKVNNSHAFIDANTQVSNQSNFKHVSDISDNIKNSVVTPGSWVLVKLKVKVAQNKNKIFIASVVNVRYSDCEVIFLDHIGDFMFSWPDHGETDYVNTESIVKVLDEPIIDDNGKLIFKWY